MGGRRRRGDRDGPPLLIAAVVVLSLIVFAMCTYCILKKRGQICKKKSTDAQTIEHERVANDSTAKKDRKKGTHHPVHQDSMYSAHSYPSAMNIDHSQV